MFQVREAQPMVDTKAPATYMHLHLKLKKLQVSCYDCCCDIGRSIIAGLRVYILRPNKNTIHVVVYQSNI